MNMQRKFLIPIAALVVIGAGIVAWFLLSKPNVCKAIPSSSVAVIKVNSWADLADKLNTTYTGMEAAKTEAVQRLQAELNTMAGLLAGDKSLLASVTSGTTLASLHLTSANSYDYLFVAAMPGINDNTLLNRVQALPSVKAVNVRIFKGNKLLEAKLKDGNAITFACSKGILMFSFTSFLTEASVSALSSGTGISNDDAFSEAYSAAKQVSGVRLLVNFPQLEIILPAVANQAYLTRLTGWKKAGDWGAFIVAFTNEEMRLTGTVFSKTKTATIKTGGNMLANALAYIPGNTALADIGVNDTALYAEDGLTASFFRTWSGDFRAFVTLESVAGTDMGQNLFLIQVKDERAAHAGLMNMLNAEGSETVAVDTFLQKPVYRLKSGLLLNRFFGNAFAEMKEPYFTVNAGLAVFANNPDVLRLAIENINNRNTLSSTEAVKQIKQDDTHFVYLNPQRGASLIAGVTQAGSTAGTFLNQFTQITMRAKDKEDAMDAELVFKAGGTSTTKQGLLWKLQLKTAATETPTLVKNKITGQNELLAQDTSGNVYLINAGGEIIFTRALGEKIFNAVEQVDYYNNGSYQYLFHSATKVYLVNEKGEDVGGYPLRLGSPATAPMSVWVDEVKKLTRYFIPSASGGIYGYEVTGKPVAGWSPRAGVGYVNKAVDVLQQQGRPQVLVSTTEGKLWLFDARGNKLWMAENMGDSVHTPVLVKQPAGFVVLQAQGTQLTAIDEDGNDRTTTLVDGADAFTAFVKDSGFVYVYATGSALRMYNDSSAFTGSTALNGAQISRLYTVAVGSTVVICVEDTTHSKLYILSSELKTLQEVSLADYVSYAALPLISNREVVILAVTRQGKLVCIR